MRRFPAIFDGYFLRRFSFGDRHADKPPQDYHFDLKETYCQRSPLPSGEYATVAGGEEAREDGDVGCGDDGTDAASRERTAGQSPPPPPGAPRRPSDKNGATSSGGAPAVRDGDGDAPDRVGDEDETSEAAVGEGEWALAGGNVDRRVCGK